MVERFTLDKPLHTGGHLILQRLRQGEHARHMAQADLVATLSDDEGFDRTFRHSLLFDRGIDGTQRGILLELFDHPWQGDNAARPMLAIPAPVELNHEAVIGGGID